MESAISTQTLSFRSGREVCAATLFMPKAISNLQAPACIVLGNTMGATRVDRLDTFAMYFAENGFAALTFDYRYFGESSGVPRQVCDIQDQIQDFNAAIDFAKKLNSIDSKRIGVWGASLAGGHVVMVGAMRNDVQAIASLAPTADCTQIAFGISKSLLARLVFSSNIDLFRLLSFRRPYYVPIVALPGQTAAMATPGVLEEYQAMVGKTSLWQNQIAARLFLWLPLYRPIRHSKKVKAPLWVGVCDNDDVASPAKALAMGRLAPRGKIQHYPASHLSAMLEPLFSIVAKDQLAFFNEHLR
jgi:uncharacterized protein